MPKTGPLLVHVQDAPDEPELGGPQPIITITQGRVDTVTVEQNGPVRAVIKVSYSSYAPCFITLNKRFVI